MKRIIPFFLFLLLAFLLFYFALPVINFGFFGLPIVLFLLVLFGILFSLKFELYDQGKKIKIIALPKRFLFIAAAIILLYMSVGPLLTSLPMFRSQSYREMIGKVHNGQELSKHIAPISLDKIRAVDESLAMLLGEKILGSQPALGSQVEIGDFTIQKVDDVVYWVAPLLHTGFFKWWRNSEGTPGYVMVSATNERDVRLVQDIGGKPVKIKYQPEAFFGSQIQRHVYFNGYETVGLGDFEFEVDDNGKPFWVVSLYKKKVGFA